MNNQNGRPGLAGERQRSRDFAGGGDLRQGGEADASLILAMARGDERALGRLYDRWSARLFSLAHFLLREESAAEEVVESTFWQAWCDASRYRTERGEVGAWLAMMARSRALERLRAEQRRAGLLDRLPAEMEEWSGGDGGDPLESAEAVERGRLVEHALKALPAEQREAIELAFFRGLTQAEIADRTQQPLGTVKTRIRLGIAKLREWLVFLREGNP